MGESRESTKLVTSKWFVGFATTFGILTWVAAAGKFVDLVWFVRVFVDNWREFFRDLWQSVAEFVRLPYQFTPNQRDALTIIAACGAIALRPSLFGFDSRPLFKDSINIFDRAEIDKNPWKWMGKAMFAALLAMALIIPFIDVTYFEKDMAVLVTGGLLSWFTFVWFRTIFQLVESRFDFRAVYRRFDPLPSGDSEISTFNNDFTSRWIQKPVVFASLMLCIPSFAVLAFDSSFRASAWEYVSTYTAINFVNVVLFIAIFVALFFACRKSIRPVFNIVMIGLALVFVAASAHNLIESYQRNFPPRVAG